MKTIRAKTILVVEIITLIMCAVIIITIVFPHHLSENKAIICAEKYMEEEISDSRVSVSYAENSEIVYVYMDDTGKNIKQLYKSELSLFQKIYNIWDPELRYYNIGLKTNVSADSIFYIAVDSFVDHAKDLGDPAIRWEVFGEKANDIQ